MISEFSLFFYYVFTNLAPYFFIGQIFLLNFIVILHLVLSPRTLIKLSTGIVFYIFMKSLYMHYQIPLPRSPEITFCTTPILYLVMDRLNVLFEVLLVATFETALPTCKVTTGFDRVLQMNSFDVKF